MRKLDAPFPAHDDEAVVTGALAALWRFGEKQVSHYALRAPVEMTM